jgi:hypothetical protein
MAASLGELWKKGTTPPLADDLVEGGLAIDVANQRVYSKDSAGNIFEIGGGFDGVHNDLPGRDEAGAHPVSAIDGLQAALDGKLTDPGDPTYSRTPLLFNPDGTRVLDKLNADDVGAAWENHGHKIAEVEDLYDELQARYKKTDHISTSTGTADAGKPIVLNPDGEIDPSMIPIDAGWHNQGYFTPVDGAEYPDTTGLPSGSFWSVAGVDQDTGYTFTGGDLAGETAYNGNLMIWAGGVWQLRVTDLNPFDYYRLDGTQAITAPFAGGGHQFKAASPATDDTDLTTYGQVKGMIEIGAY